MKLHIDVKPVDAVGVPQVRIEFVPTKPPIGVHKVTGDTGLTREIKALMDRMPPGGFCPIGGYVAWDPDNWVALVHLFAPALVKLGYVVQIEAPDDLWDTWDLPGSHAPREVPGFGRVLY